MINTLLKLCAFVLIYRVAALPNRGLRYRGWGYPVTMAALMAAVGGVADRVLVPRLGNLPSTALGTAFMVGTTWLSGRARRVTVPVAGALMVGALGAVYEYASHAFLLSISRQSHNLTTEAPAGKSNNRTYGIT